MGLFNMFKKKEDYTKVNNLNKTQILTLIQNVHMNCKNPEAISLLRNIQEELQGQGETPSAEVVGIDRQIQALLSEANTYVVKQQYAIVLTKLNKAFSLAADRRQHCAVGGQMTKADKKAKAKADKITANLNKNVKKTRAEELEEEIEKKTAELAIAEAEFQKLKKLHEANPANSSILSQGRAKQIQITALKNQLSALSNEHAAETTVKGQEDILAAGEQLASNRTYTAEQVQINTARLAEQEARNQEAADIAKMGLQSMQTSAIAMDPFAEESAFNPFAESNVFGQASGAQSAFTPGKMSSQEMANDIKATVKALQKSIDAYTEKIDTASEDFEDCNAQLKPLLIKRQTASASDCLLLDGQIDQINAKRSSIVYKIKRYRQAVAELNDKLTIMDKLSTQQDMESTNAKIAELTGGKFNDYLSLAAYLDDAVKASNASLEELSTAVNLSESEGILMNSAAGATAALTDAATVKDEDKYASLEQEMGVARPRTLN